MVGEQKHIEKMLEVAMELYKTDPGNWKRKHDLMRQREKLEQDFWHYRRWQEESKERNREQNGRIKNNE